MIFAPSAPPLPRDQTESLRVQHTRNRRKILYSMHQSLVEERIYRAVGTTRANATRVIDMTSNPGWYVCSQLSALYREIPEVVPPIGGEDTAAAIDEAGYWQLSQRIQRDTIAMNDSFVRVSVDKVTGDPSFHLVPADLVEVTASPLFPSQPLAMREWIPDPDNQGQWVQLRTDPRNRTYQAVDTHEVDVTERVLGEPSFSGDLYPFIVGGKPVLPYVAYHSAESGYALDPYTGSQVWDGALQLGMYYSFFGHILRQASWSQRWLLNAEPAGGDLDESGRRKDTVADPATAVVLRQLEDGAGQGQAQVGQWAPPVDPDRILASIERYEQRLVEMALSTVGVSRRDSDVRSAMSLAVSREAQREAQRAYEPMFRRSDTRLLRLVAGLRGEPVEGWRINYRSLPRDPGELAAELARMQGMIASGLMDRVTAYRELHPGLTVEEATKAIQAIKAINDSYELGESKAIPEITSGAIEAQPVAVAQATSPIALTSTDIASIVTVNEARASQGLPGIDGPDGSLTVAEYQAKHASVIASAANAAAGQPSTP